MIEYDGTLNYCGWCGQPFPNLSSKLGHEKNFCEVAEREQMLEIDREEQRRLESQLWEEEYGEHR